MDDFKTPSGIITLDKELFVESWVHQDLNEDEATTISTGKTAYCNQNSNI